MLLESGSTTPTFALIPPKPALKAGRNVSARRTYLGLVEHHLIAGQLGHCAGAAGAAGAGEPAGGPAGAQRAEGSERGAPGRYKHGCGTGHAFHRPAETEAPLGLRESAAGAETCAGATVGRINPPERQQLCSHVMRALLISSVQALHKQGAGEGRGVQGLAAKAEKKQNCRF